MITVSGVGRFLASSAVGLVFLTAACSEVVAKDNVAKTIMDQLQKQSIDAQHVMCPTDLQAIVGQTVRCPFMVDGQPVDAIATVTSVDGSNVKYDITTEARRSPGTCSPARSPSRSPSRPGSPSIRRPATPTSSPRWAP